jgi:hypothetical protein
MDPRTLCLVGMVGFPALAALNALVVGNELARFLDSTPAIASTHDLERFKTVVAHQMIAALVQIALLGAPMLILFGGLLTGVLTPSDVMWVILPSLAILGIAALYRRGELRAKTLPAADLELERQRDAIVHTWMRKPWPDW